MGYGVNFCSVKLMVAQEPDALANSFQVSVRTLGSTPSAPLNPEVTTLSSTDMRVAWEV